MESYHLSVQHLSTGNFKVTHHDLPAFIVASGLPDNLKVKDLPSLVRPVRELLAMFVMRREELKVAEVGRELQTTKSKNLRRKIVLIMFVLALKKIVI